ncbi:LysR substrate-binding domain-containing protein [Cupriavidus necator]|uniref:LysR substrate-binding domain-containing protein n=1 Tax=Cupriavidus necator TaxID=106590 RepID=UPI00339DA15E
MEFRHLRYFLVLAEELHFGRAARRLAISQPPLSLNIQQLEASVGARLFDRDSRGVRLTAAGRAFQESATALLAQAEAARVLAREIEAGAVGRLRVGFVGSMLYRGLPQYLRDFQAAYPGIQVALTELNSQEQIDALLHDALDAAFIHTGRVPDPLQAALVHSEPFVCCLPADHPLAARAELPLAELREEPFVLFSRKASPDYYSRIFDMCAAQGFYPQIRHEVRHWLSVVSLVSQGMGVAVVPAALARSGMAGAAFRPLAGTGVRSEVYCAWKAAPDHPARDNFVGMVRAAAAHKEKATGAVADGL